MQFCSETGELQLHFLELVLVILTELQDHFTLQESGWDPDEAQLAAPLINMGLYK